MAFTEDPPGLPDREEFDRRQDECGGIAHFCARVHEQGGRSRKQQEPLQKGEPAQPDPLHPGLLEAEPELILHRRDHDCGGAMIADAQDQQQRGQQTDDQRLQ